MPTTRKRRGKLLLYSLGVLVFLLVVAFLIANERLPDGESGARADTVARQMLKAINHSQWQQTGAVEWKFRGVNHHLWDRKRKMLMTKWNGTRVLADLNGHLGLAWRDGEPVTGEEEKKLVKKARSMWMNDSFWLNAPAKVFDTGTGRYLVQQEDGSEGLLVNYTTGGDTPGDSYLWQINEEGMPVSVKMWVQILPVGGVEFTWQDWQTLESGAKVATMHNGPVTINLEDVKGGADLQALGYDTDPFEPLLQKLAEEGN